MFTLLFLISQCKVYEDKMPSDQLLQNVADHVPKECWKPLFRSLMKSDRADIEIEIIEMKNQNDLREMKYQSLRKWKLSAPKEAATVGTLDRALRDVDCPSVAERISRFIESK